MTERVVDQEARDKIVGQIGLNFLVEAGAGSGKTTCLVERIVNIIVSGTGKINEIAAITFTRKAADDLKLRFLSKLEEKLKIEKKRDKKLKLEEAMKNIDHCFLGTVHSFCSKLLRERSIEAGLGPAFVELEEADDERIMKEAWKLYLSTLPTRNPKQYEQLNEIGIREEQVQSFLSEMKKDPDVDWIVHQTKKPSLQSAYHELINLFMETRRMIPDREPDGGYDRLQQMVIQVLKKAKHINEKIDSNIIGIFEMVNKKIKVTAKKWPSRKIALEYDGRISTFINGTIKPLLQQWKEYCHPIITDTLKGGLYQYEQLKKSRSLVNFQDLLLMTAELLKNNPEVRQYFQQKYRFLMIDEYQDSDPIQAEMMFLLTAENPYEEDWTKCKPKPGSLFIVGDPKQAIYRFRRADIDTYNRVKQLINEHGGEVLQLTMNFRTIDGITKALNTVFEKELPEMETRYQAAYRPLNSFFKSTGKGFEGIKVLTVSEEFAKKEEIIAEDANNIARTIQSLLKEGHEPKAFMILSRYTDAVPLYAEALEKRNIPVNISGEVILGEQKEYKELKLLLQFLSDPGDSLALVAVLRGIFFGISDQELYEWKRSGGVFSINYSADMPGIDEVAKGKITASLDMLQKYSDWVHAYMPTVALEKIIADIGLYALLLTKHQSKQMFTSLLQIIETLKKYESDGDTTFLEILNRFTKLVDAKTTAANFESGENAVSVMNVHKSKGLEAEIVFLAHPAKKVDLATMITKHICREDHQSKGHIGFYFKKGFQITTVGLPTNWDEYKAEEYRYLMEEEKRILYVAVTRAEKALIISSSEASNKKNPWERFLHIDGIEQLDFPVEDELPTMKESVVFSAVSFEEEISSMQFWLDNSQGKSYEKWSPTEDKDYMEIHDVQREEGGGMQWGTLIHDVLEKLVNNEDMDSYIPKVMAKYQISDSKAVEVNGYIETVKSSFFWRDLQIADEVYTEIPVHIAVEQHSPLRCFIESDVNAGFL